MAEENTVRIVLIGKTGAGKSSVGNTILGENKFPPMVGMQSGTVKTGWETVFRDDCNVQVTDTPGVCDTHREPEEVYTEIAKCMITAAPGPHAVIMVFKASERFTEEEGKAYDELKDLFKGVSDFLIVVFTRVDELEHSLESELQTAPLKVDEIIKEAGGRYLGIKNKTGGAERRAEGDKLMDVIYELKNKNNGKYYSNKIFQNIAKKVDEQAQVQQTTTDVVIRETIEEKNSPFLEKAKKIIGFLPFKFLCPIL